MPGNRHTLLVGVIMMTTLFKFYILIIKHITNQVFKIKQTDQGLMKALEKPDTFNPPENDNFERVSRSIEVLYSGAKVLGTDTMLNGNLLKT